MKAKPLAPMKQDAKIQTKAMPHEPGAVYITSGKSGYWMKMIDNPNLAPEAPAQAPASAAPPPPAPYNPTAAVTDNFDPSSMQIKVPESDPAIKQLQQNLIKSVTPPDTSALTSQLSGIQQGMQNLQSIQINPTSLQPVNQLTAVGGMLQNGLSALNDGTTATSPSTPTAATSYSPTQLNLEGLMQQRLAELSQLQNQAGWRQKAAAGMGSKSAEYVKSEDNSESTGTYKLNRNFKPKDRNRYMNDLLINSSNDLGLPSRTNDLGLPSRSIDNNRYKQSSTSHSGVKIR